MKPRRTPFRAFVRWLLAAFAALPLSLAFVVQVHAQIAVDSTASKFSTTNATSLNWPHTVGSATNRILLVGVSIANGATVTSATYGGTALTRINKVNSGASFATEMWYLLAPASGTASVIVNFSASDSVAAGSMSFSGVDQTTPLGTSATASGSGGTPSVTVTSAANQLVFDTITDYADKSSLTAGGSQTQRWNVTSGSGGKTDVISGGSTQPGAASTTMSWTIGAAKAWSMMAVPLRPAPVAASCGTLGINSALYGSSSLSTANAKIYTDAAPGGLSISGTGSAVNTTTGARYNPSPTPTLPALSPSTFPSNSSTTDNPSPLVPGNYRTISTGGTTFPAGNYNIKTLTITGGTINFGPGTYNIGTITLGNGAKLVVNGSGAVRLNIGTTFSAPGGGPFTVNSAGTADQFQLFVYPGATVSVANTMTATMLVYAPDSTSSVSFGNTTTITGAVIGSNVSVGNTTKIYYTNAVQTALAGVSTCSAGSIDHYELSLPTSSLTCLPTTVTVTACNDNSSPCTNAATTVSGQTATLGTTGATLGATTVSFNASGVASTTLSYPAASNGTAVSVTLSGEQSAATNSRQCCPNGSGCSVASSCSTTFNTAGFIVSASANGTAATIPAQTAGTASGTYYLRAVQTNTTTKACESALSGANTVNWAYECKNPTSCSGSNLLSLTGNSATTIQRNNNGAVSGYLPVAMTFDANGNAAFSFTFGDVGQITLWASDTVNSATLSGSSNAFVVKPAGFTVSNIKQTAAPQLANPAAASATDARFVKAGESFTATVTAVTSGGAATPNYGKETVPEGVLLTRALVQPGGGATGTLANGTIAGASFTSGAATATSLSFSEVGIITLTPSVADGDYLGAGNVTGTTSVNVGRFFPAQFALSAASVTHRSAQSCSPASAFTYLGENFRLGFTLTAQNTSGATTTNYSGSFAKLDPTSPTGFNLAGRDATTVFTTGSGRLSLGTSTGSFSGGVASGIALTANALRATAPDGPFSAAFGIAPADSDGVAMASFDMASASGGGNDRASVGTVALRFGRLRLTNAVGSQTRSLALPLVAQSWTGSAFDTNTLDSCTTVPAAAVSFGNLRRTLSTADTAVSGASVLLASGVGSLRLAAPSGGRYGSADVALSLGSSATDASCLQPWTPGTGDAATAGANLDFLRGAWCGSSYGNDPSARATWGDYRGSDAVLYQRENY